MKTADEMRSCIKNIRYYAEKIGELSIQQIELDTMTHGLTAGPQNPRFMSLGCIGDASTWLKSYCQNIEVNIRNAEKLEPETAGKE